MTDNISVNALKPRLGQPGSENPNLIIPPSAGPTGRSKNKNSEGKPLTCSDEDEGCVGSKHCRVGKLKHWCKTEEQKCIFLLSCDEVTINAVNKMFSPAERKIPNRVPCLNLSNSITWWKWAGREDRAGTQTCCNFNTDIIGTHSALFIIHTATSNQHKS